ncbi:MAG: hypothetical protein C4348_00005, partial [Patescibacteria group bacterium]
MKKLFLSFFLFYLFLNLGQVFGFGGTRPQCNTNEVQLSISPNHSNLGDVIRFFVSSGDASTWWRNEFSDPNAVINCNETRFGWETQCRANKPGTFTWTRIWRHCEGNFDNCSEECRKTVSFTINPRPQCNTNEVQLSVSPNPSNLGDVIRFFVSSGDATT